MSYSVLTREPWCGRFSSWGPIASGLAVGVMTFKLAVFASRATILAVVHGNEEDLSAYSQAMSFSVLS